MMDLLVQAWCLTILGSSENGLPSVKQTGSTCHRPQPTEVVPVYKLFFDHPGTEDNPPKQSHLNFGDESAVVLFPGNVKPMSFE